MPTRQGKLPGRLWLMTGGMLSGAAAALHLACIAGGGDWYRTFGAGEAVASAAERGEAMPTLMTLAIAAVLAFWAAYAFSGAGWIARLPLLRAGLVAISGIYLARAAMGLVPELWGRSDLSAAFVLWSSLIVLVYGVVHAIGIWRAWPRLSKKEAY